MPSLEGPEQLTAEPGGEGGRGKQGGAGGAKGEGRQEGKSAERGFSSTALPPPPRPHHCCLERHSWEEGSVFPCLPCPAEPPSTPRGGGSQRRFQGPLWISPPVGGKSPSQPGLIPKGSLEPARHPSSWSGALCGRGPCCLVGPPGLLGAGRVPDLGPDKAQVLPNAFTGLWQGTAGPLQDVCAVPGTPRDRHLSE